MKRIVSIIVSILMCATFLVMTPTALAQVISSIETETKDASYIQFGQVTGLSDEAIQTSLNESLKSFSVGSELDDAPDRIYDSVEGTTKLSIIGDKYISVRTEYFYSGTSLAHPWARLGTAVYDLTTGELAGPVNSFILVDEELRKLITDGVFVMTHPYVGSEGIPGAAETFAQDYVNDFDPQLQYSSFYLTDTTFGLVLGDRIHAEGDYWTIEAPYDSVLHLLSADLIAALGK